LPIKLAYQPFVAAGGDDLLVQSEIIGLCHHHVAIRAFRFQGLRSASLND
jgi:hypothetical protein